MIFKSDFRLKTEALLEIIKGKATHEWIEGGDHVHRLSRPQCECANRDTHVGVAEHDGVLVFRADTIEVDLETPRHRAPSGVRTEARLPRRDTHR